MAHAAQTGPRVGGRHSSLFWQGMRDDWQDTTCTLLRELQHLRPRRLPIAHLTSLIAGNRRCLASLTAGGITARLSRNDPSKENVMIGLLPGIISGFVGFAIGRGCGFWLSCILATISAAILMHVPWGIWIAEFPIGLLIGGVASALTPQRKGH